MKTRNVFEILSLLTLGLSLVPIFLWAEDIMDRTEIYETNAKGEQTVVWSGSTDEYVQACMEGRKLVE